MVKIALTDLFNADFSNITEKLVILTKEMIILKFFLLINRVVTGQTSKFRVRVGSGKTASQIFRVGYGSGN